MIQGRWMPQTEEEWTLLQDLHIVTRMAHQEGVSQARISSLLAFMASAAAQDSAFKETSHKRSQSLEGQMEEQPQTQGDNPLCPGCGDPLNNIGGGLGEARCSDCGEKLPQSIVGEVLYDD